MADISKVIQDRGGVVDKNLGDGLLCYFGYDFSGGGAIKSHAEDALKAAIKIQKLVVTEILEKAINDEKYPVLPLRIGINSGEVFVGDLGGSNRIEFTIIGDTVNYAQRLESASEDFLIMLGESTVSRLPTTTREQITTEPRMIKIKHHDNLFKAYEVNPYMNTAIDLEKARRLFVAYSGKIDRSTRHKVTPGAITVETSYGKGYVVNVSELGVSVVLDVFLAKDVTLAFHLSDIKNHVSWHLEELNLSPALLQVKWGRKIRDSQYEHGLVLQFINETQASRFLGGFISAPGIIEK